MNLTKAHEPQKQMTEGLEVGSITKTARSNSDHLSIWSKQMGRQSKERRIQVARLDPGLTQKQALARV